MQSRSARCRSTRATRTEEAKLYAGAGCLLSVRAFRPSDGIVFIDSCAAPDGVGTLADTAILKNVNHLQLGWHEQSVAQLTAWLGD